MSNKIKGLFLDDERFPQDVAWVKYPDNVEWRVVRTYQDFVACYMLNDYDVFSFDHDIQCFENGREMTGYDALKVTLDAFFDVDNTLVFFHTQNPIGKKNMESYYQNYIKFMKNAG